VWRVTATPPLAAPPAFLLLKGVNRMVTDTLRGYGAVLARLSGGDNGGGGCVVAALRCGGKMAEARVADGRRVAAAAAVGATARLVGMEAVSAADWVAAAAPPCREDPNGGAAPPLVASPTRRPVTDPRQRAMPPTRIHARY